MSDTIKPGTQVRFTAVVPCDADYDDAPATFRPGDTGTVVASLGGGWYSAVKEAPAEIRIVEHNGTSWAVEPLDYRDDADAIKRGIKIASFSVREDEFITINSDHQENEPQAAG